MRRLAVALVAMLALAGCGTDAPPPRPSLAVGAAPTRESALLAELYASALRYFGTAAHVQTQPDPVTALDTGAVTVVPGLTGELLTRFAPHPAARADEQVYREMISALPEGVAAADYTASAQDKPAVAVAAATAVAWGGGDVAALLQHCPGVTVGVVAGAVHPARVGDCRLPPAREFADVAALFDALTKGAVTLAWTSTAAPAAPTDVVVLSDKTSLIRAENVVPLYRRNELSEQQVLALNGIAGELDTVTLTDMLSQVQRGADPANVAGAWLAQHPLDH
ncbi:glycine betaine ABC transporter substrate-binding protein [Mycobacterium sp. MAA66]|uniref:glycine betaine ABC transporter substrate-binding protein n=1 Tax=Mycobacterium sp. MAA66 TaxID=3156297 RepID=UPI003516D84B